MRRKRYIIGGAALLGISAATAFALSLSQRDLFGLAYVPSSMLSLFNVSGDANSNSGNTSSGSIAGSYASNTQGSDSLGTLDLPPDSMAINTDTEVAGLQGSADPSDVDETTDDPDKGTGEQGQGTDDPGQSQTYGFSSSGGGGFTSPQRFAALTTMSTSDTDGGTGDTGGGGTGTGTGTGTDCILGTKNCPTQTQQIAFQNSGEQDDENGDTPTKVDEPGTLSLLLMGGLGLLLARRRATRKTA